MRVRITQAFAEGYRVFNPGQEFDAHPAMGAAYLQRGVAERIDPVPEEAALEAPPAHIPPRVGKRGRRKESTR
jgi:hypothetical protein